MFSSASRGLPAAICPSSGSFWSSTAAGCHGFIETAGFAPVADEVERARLRRVAPEQAGPLEVRQVRVDGGRRSQPDRLADLAHGRGIAVPVDVVDEELPDLLLPCGQLGVR